MTTDAAALAAAADALGALAGRVRERLVPALAPGGRVDSDALHRRQLAAHGLAHLAATAEAARELAEWARDGGELDRRIAGAWIGEQCLRAAAGVALGPCERVGAGDLGVTRDDLAQTVEGAAARAVAERFASADAIVALGRDVAAGATGDPRLDDDALEATRSALRRFTARAVAPVAQRIHLRDELVPLELVAELAELGVFGLTIAEEHGGGGQGKLAMCVVTEEIARGSLGVASLATRSEIAADLIGASGTDAQRRSLLPGIARGSILPTAVFTEPDHGSDLARIQTRALRQRDGSYRLFGQKTWITHAARADLMTLLARTDPGDRGHGGLSMFLATKARGLTGRDFVDPGLSGTEIGVLGYRGMKEYELAFDGFAVAGDALLGGVEGAGFKQLMATFESARIQTAARAVGVAQAALDEALRYARERRQFGRPIVEHPRVARKLGGAVASVMAARRLTHFAARAKDVGRRCDLEAGMAKLLATSVAWETADAAVQVHGGAGYALESTVSRLLVDARVLSLFEGTSEIQANVIARRLLEAP